MSPVLRDGHLAWLQTLASRRTDIRHWELKWKPYEGVVQVRHAIQIVNSASVAAMSGN